jgi:hypothetical protein
MDDTLAKDFMAMWQSELTAIAADREVRESWATFAALWAQATVAALTLLSAHEPAAGSPRPPQPARSAAAAAASQPRLDEVDQLKRRIAELEQRLAEFMAREHGPGATMGGV